MIVTLTPNPSVDRTLAIDALEPGGVHRSAAPTVEAGGKGINVTRALSRFGFDSVALVPCDPQLDQSFLELLRHANIEFEPIDAAGPIRSNVSIIETDGRTTKINEPGAAMSSEQVERVLDVCASAASRATWLAGCGSLPPGMDDDFYSQLALRVAPKGVKLAIDTSGPGLRHLLNAPCTVVKPNRREFEEMLDVTVSTLGDVVSAAREVVTRSASDADRDGPIAPGPRNILVSLGADGALLATPEVVVHGRTVEVDVRNTVGAGDALLAGFLAAAADGRSPIDAECLGEGLAWARASLRSETTAFAPATDADRQSVSMTEIVRGDQVVDRPLLQRPLVDES